MIQKQGDNFHLEICSAVMYIPIQIEKESCAKSHSLLHDSNLFLQNRHGTLKKDQKEPKSKRHVQDLNLRGRNHKITELFIQVLPINHSGNMPIVRVCPICWWCNLILNRDTSLIKKWVGGLGNSGNIRTSRDGMRAQWSSRNVIIRPELRFHYSNYTTWITIPNLTVK